MLSTLTPHRTARLLVQAARNVGTLRALGDLKGLAAKKETEIHKVADAHVTKIEVAVRYAFARGRQALGTPPNADRASKAVAAALHKTLRPTLLACMKAGGEVALGGLRTLGDVEGHPFHGNQWTGGIGSPEGKVWFGDSKVVDAEGKPLVVYHRGGFDEQNEEAPTIGDEGMHFGTKNAADARPVGKGVDDTIKSIEIEKDEETGRYHWSMDGADSFDIDENGFDSAADARSNAEQQASDMGDNSEWDERDHPLTEAYLNISNPMRVTDQAGDWTKAIAKAKAAGHDGIVYKNMFEDKGSTSYIVFKPTQIKSTKAKKFDKNNPLVTAESLRTLKPPLKKKIGAFNLQFDAKNARAAKWALEHVGWLIDSITQTTRERIQEAVARAQIGGDLKQQYEDILAAVGDESRANLIARSESMTAALEGQRIGWDEAVDAGLLPADVTVAWIATEGACPECLELDGETRTLDGEYPGDGGRGPILHPACRCSEGITG